MTKKHLLAVLALACHAAMAVAADVAPNPAGVASAAQAVGPPVTGVVLEVKDVDSFTYLRLRTPTGETWAAVTRSPFRNGDSVRLEQTLIVDNFESKSLKRTFPTIVFGKVVMAAGKPVAALPIQAAAPGQLPPGHPPLAQAPAVQDVKVPKAVGANARTVAEILTNGADLKDKPVLVRGKVVKFNGGIMGRNWIHLRDGSGQASDNTHDLVITTGEAAKLGELLTVKGVVHTDRDFGAGYAFRVMVEDASLQR